MKKNLGLKLLVLLISIILWFQQTLLQEHTVTLAIPFKLVNIPSRLIPEPYSKKTVSTSVKARGIDILLMKFLDVHFRIDASKFSYGSNVINLSLSDLVLPEHVSIKLEKMEVKEKLVISMDRLVTKKKPIHINYVSVKDLEYFLKNKIDIANKRVKIRGALSAVKAVKKIESEKISRKMVKNGMINIRLIPPTENIVLLEPEITLRVVEQKSVSKTISLIPISYPQTNKVTIIPQKVSVMIRGPQNIINKIKRNDIEAYVDNEAIKKNGFAEIKFNIPKGITLVDYTPRQVQVIK